MVEKILLSYSEAARLAGVSRPTVYRWAKLDGFPTFRLGGVSKIPSKAFEAWILERAGVVSG